MSGRRAAAVLALAALVMVAACSRGSGDGRDGRGTSHASRSGAPQARPSPGCERADPGSTAGEHTIDVGGTERRYLLAVPAEAETDRPLPLVLLLHGFASNADQFAALTRLPAEGAARGVLVATPDAIGGQWGLGADGADAAFVDAVVEEITTTSCVDLDRISVAGMSLGSAFGTIYACARPDRIAAIAAVTVEFQLGCTEATAIVAFHGTADPLVPYQDGAVGTSLPGPVRGTELNMTDWAALGGCRLEPATHVVGTEIVRRSWGGCAPGVDVVLYTVDGGGHTWPGADPAAQAGHTTDQVDATREILEFLARHRLT